MGNFLRPRRELEAWIIEPCQEIIEALGGLLHLLPQRRRLPLVGIGGLDRRFKRVGDGLEQHGVLVLGAPRRQQGDLGQGAAKHRAAVGNDMRARQLQAALA